MPSAEAKRAEQMLKATEKRHVELQAAAYMNNLNKLDKLVDAESFDSWCQALHTVAYNQDWPDWILDITISDLDVPESDQLSLKELANVKNAYTAILELSAGHEVEDELKPPSVARGDAREAFAVLHRHHYAPTEYGKREIMSDFYGMTQANTNTTVSKFVALAKSRRTILEQSTLTTVPDATVVSIILGGLIQEFTPVVDIMEGWADSRLTLKAVSLKLKDYAKKHKLTTRTKVGDLGTRNKVFSAAVGSPPNVVGKRWRGLPWLGGVGDCQLFMDAQRGGAGCPRGSSCSFAHPPGKGKNLRVESKDWRSRSGERPAANYAAKQPSSTCNHCGKPGHWAINCTKRKAELEQMQEASAKVATAAANFSFHSGRSNSNSTHGDRQADHVFTVHAGPARRSPIAPPTLWAAFALFFTTLISCIIGAPRALLGSVKGATAVLIITLGVLVLAMRAESSPTLAIASASVYNGQQGGSEQHTGLEWCSDTGTNRFVTNDAADFIPDTVKHTPTIVAVGSGNVTSPMTGDVLVRSRDHDVIIRCTDVLLLPDCVNKLMPASPFIRKGCTIVMSPPDKVLLTTSDGSPLFTGRERSGLYYYNSETLRDRVTPAVEPEEQSYTFFGLRVGSIREGAADFGSKLLQAHWAYGHLHFTKLRKLLGLKPGDDPDCAACTIANARRRTLSKKRSDRSTRANHRLHLDLGFTQDCDLCFQLAVDDYTRESFIDILDSKAGALESFQTLQRRRDNDHAPYSLAYLKTDSEPVYTAAKWDDLCKEQGYKREFSSRHRHDQHGVVERAMQSIGGPFRSMMIQGNAPKSDEPHALRMSNVIRNNSPTRANNGLTPREKAAGMRLPVNKRLLEAPMFCLCFALVYDAERHKHANRGIPCVYLGYDDVNNAFLVKEWVAGKVYYTADVTFHPLRYPYRANPERFSDYLHQYDPLAPDTTVTFPDFDASLPGPGPAPSTRPVRQRQPSAKAIENAQLFINDSTPRKNHYVHNFGNENPTWDEAMLTPFASDWIIARLKEYNSFQEHEVYEVVPRSEARGKRIFKSKPVLKMKINPPDLQHPLGSIDQFKYRLTIAAYTKMLKQGIDYKEKYASTVRWNSIKILIAIAVKFDFDIVLFDISTFFLYGKLGKGEEMFMEQPPDWATPDKPAGQYIWRLLRSMYGLPQAPHCAQQELKVTLTADKKFESTASDDCIYVSQSQDVEADDYAALGAHVDDMMAIGTSTGLDNIRTTLKEKFKITEVINPSVITGVQIDRNRAAKWLKLHQTAYTEKVLANHNMSECKGVTTPMDPGTAKALMLLPTEDTNPEVTRQYQVLVGELLWLLKTRPDMYFTVSLLCRFLKNPTQQHLDLASNRPLRYLRQTTSFGLVFSAGDGDWVLSGASDSDLAGDLISARSTLGHCLKLGECGAVVVQCGLDKKVSTATGQAETYAMQSLVKDTVWARRFLSELGCPMRQPTVLRTDNDGVLKQSTKTINHTAAKHYRIAQAYIREKVSDKTIAVIGENSANNETDIFTKALNAPPFVRHRTTLMGPQECPPRSF